MIWLILYLLCGTAALFTLTYTDPNPDEREAFGADYGLCILIVFAWPLLFPASVVWLANKLRAKKK